MLTKVSVFSFQPATIWRVGEIGEDWQQLCIDQDKTWTKLQTKGVQLQQKWYEIVDFIAEFFEENFESKENDTQILKNVNRHIYLCKQLNKTTFSLWLLSIRI
jgi:UTP:GlnB (protein PII) uridylyltransferase